MTACHATITHDHSGLRTGRAAFHALVRDVLSRAAGELGFRHASVGILFCSRKRMQEMNRQFLGQDRPTDVLSFPDSYSPELLDRLEPCYLGDIAICLPYCRDAAIAAGRDVTREVLLLLLHGLLHLIGHDHDTAPRKRLMWRETDRLMALVLPATLPPLDIREITS
jgi:probable rRNA maturation factor